jgi:cell division septation protein DedD
VEEEDNTQDDADEKPAAAAPAASPASSAALPKIRVQLAALPSQEEANKTWQRLLKKFPSELSDKKNYVVRVTVKGKVYYRLQVGPLASAHAAENLCMTMISTGQACIVAK